MTTPLTGPVPTLWTSDSVSKAWLDAKPLLIEAKPPAVQLHTWSPGIVADQVRAALPGVQIIVGVGIDSIARALAGATSTATAVKRFLSIADAAAAAGAVAIVWNAEGDWKTRDQALAAKLRVAIREGTAAVAAKHPSLAQWHTAYDQVTMHSSYAWEAWLGEGSPVIGSLPQVYAAPTTGVAARGALQRREQRCAERWADAVRRRWISAACDRQIYLQAHHVPTADTCAVAVKYRWAAFWTIVKRSDEAGQKAFRALCALHRLGYWGDGAIQRFQASAGLAADGIVGPKTLAALGV